MRVKYVLKETARPKCWPKFLTKRSIWLFTKLQLTKLHLILFRTYIISTVITKFQKQSSEVFLGKGFLKTCSKFTREHACRSVISIKLQSKFIEITLRHGCSPVNLLHLSEYLFLWTAVDSCFWSLKKYLSLFYRWFYFLLRKEKHIGRHVYYFVFFWNANNNCFRFE